MQVFRLLMVPVRSSGWKRKKLGRWTGVAYEVGQAMAFWILPTSCRPIARSSVSPLSQEDLISQEIAIAMVDLDQKIAQRIGDQLTEEQVADGSGGLFPDVPDDLYDDGLDDNVSE
jgi:hypothetical protein